MLPHTLIVSTTATDFGTESHLSEGRSGSNQKLDGPCVQDRMTSTFCSRSVTESLQEVMFSSALVRLSVCKQDYAETTSPIFTKFSGKAAHGPMKKRSDLVGNPDMDQEFSE